MRRGVHYVGLDLLRFAAAWLVVADHFGAYGWFRPTAAVRGDALAFPFLNRMENIGGVGVEIFFLISGFVIAASAVGVSAGGFLAKRAIRVLPALWLCGLVALVARTLGGEPLGFLLASTLRSAVLSPIGPYIDGVVWTLVVEAVFYALVFAVLWRGAFDRLETVARALGLVSAAFLAVFACAEIVAPHNPLGHAMAALCGRYPCKVLMLRHGVFFSLGIALWRGFEHDAQGGFGRRRLSWMALFAGFASVEIALDRGSAIDVAIALALWWGALLAMVGSVLAADRLRRGAGRLGPLVADMGRFSYPLYLNHYVLGMALVPALAATGLSRGGVLVLALGIVAASSWLVMRYPERWAQRWLRARLVRRQIAGEVARQAARPLAAA